MKTYQRKHRACIKATTLAMVCLFLINSIAWADPSSTNLSAESRLKPFFEKHGLDFQNIATVVYTADKLKDLVMSGSLRQSQIMNLNKLFPDGAIKIDKNIRQGTLKSGKVYNYAIFSFKKELKAISVLFIKDHGKLTDDELSELRIKKDEAYHLDYSGLEGVWFVRQYEDHENLVGDLFGIEKELKERLKAPSLIKLFDAPQRGRFHKEGPTIKHHLQAMLNALNSPDNDAFKKILPPRYRDLLRSKENRNFLIWFIILHDIGKSATMREGINNSISNWGHELKSAELIDEYGLAKDLRISDREALKRAIRLHMGPFDSNGVRPEIQADFNNYFTKEGFDKSSFEIFILGLFLDMAWPHQINQDFKKEMPRIAQLIGLWDEYEKRLKQMHPLSSSARSLNAHLDRLDLSRGLPENEDIIKNIPGITDVIAMPEGYVMKTDGLGTRAIVKVNNEDIFNPVTAAFIRRAIVDQVVERNAFKDREALTQRFFRAGAVFLNPTNACGVGCAHCLYSINTKAGKIDRNQKIDVDDLDATIPFLLDSRAHFVQFAGGGEPFNNIPAVVRVVESLPLLTNIVFVTSNHFAQTPASTKRTLDKLEQANLTRIRKGWGPVTYTIRVSWDSSKKDVVPPITAKNLVDEIEGRKAKGDTQFTVAFRMILYDGEKLIDQEKLLAGVLSAKIYPEHVNKGVFPSRNIKLLNGNVIKIVYRPFYRDGRGKTAKIEDTKYSLQELIDQTVRHYGAFYLATRGDESEGYGPLLCVVNEDKPESTQPEAFQLAPYIPATGKVLLNGGAPDNSRHFSEYTGWEDFLMQHLMDPLERFGIEHGVLEYPNIAQEVSADIWQRIHATNFALEIPLQSMATPALRLYVMLRLMQRYAAEGVLDKEKLDPAVRSLLELSPELLRERYLRSISAKEGQETPLVMRDNDGSPRDPAGGQEQSLWHIYFASSKTPAEVITAWLQNKRPIKYFSDKRQSIKQAILEGKASELDMAYSDIVKKWEDDEGKRLPFGSARWRRTQAMADEHCVGKSNPLVLLARTVFLTEELLSWNDYTASNERDVNELIAIVHTFEEIFDGMFRAIVSGEIDPLRHFAVMPDQAIVPGKQSANKVILLSGTYNPLHYGHILDALASLLAVHADCAILAPTGGKMLKIDATEHKPDALDEGLRHELASTLLYVFAPFIRYSPAARGFSGLADKPILELIKTGETNKTTVVLFRGSGMYHTHYFPTFEMLLRNVISTMSAVPKIEVLVFQRQGEEMPPEAINEIHAMYQRLGLGNVQITVRSNLLSLSATAIRTGESRATSPEIIERVTSDPVSTLKRDLSFRETNLAPTPTNVKANAEMALNEPSSITAPSGVIAKAFLSNVRSMMDKRAIFTLLAQRDVTDVLDIFGKETSKKQADYLIILGNHDIEVFKAALRLFEKGVAKQILISGGRGRLTGRLIGRVKSEGLQIAGDEKTVSEAEIIKQYLLHLAKKINVNLDDKIRVEMLSKTTPDNFKESVKRYQLQGRTIIYMTTPLQQLRTRLTFEKLNTDNSWNITGISYAPYLPQKTDVIDNAELTSQWETVFGEPDSLEYGQNKPGEMCKLVEYGPAPGNDSIASVVDYCAGRNIDLEAMYFAAIGLGEKLGLQRKANDIRAAWFKLIHAREAEQSRLKGANPAPIEQETPVTQSALRNGASTTASVKYDADKIHTENLNYTPTIPDKTILCHIVTDLILPIQQRDMLKALEQDMRNDKYSEKVVSLSVKDSSSPEEFMKELERIKAQEEARYSGYTVQFDVACPSTDLVGNIQGLGMQALAFTKEGDGDMIQVEGIILALRALQTGSISNLLNVYNLLTGRELIASTNNINELARILLFTLHVRKIDINQVGTINRLIERNIKAAA